MPLNVKLFNQFMAKLRQQDEFSIVSPEAMSQQILELQGFIKNTAIPEEPSSELIERMTDDQYTAYKSQSIEPRTLRARLLQSLTDLNKDVLAPEPTRSIGYVRVRTLEMAETANEALKPHDVDPQNILAFIQSEEGRESIIKASKIARDSHPNDFKKWREIFLSERNKTLGEQFFQHLARETVNEQGYPASLSRRDLLILMRDYVDYENAINIDEMKILPNKMARLAQMLKSDFKCSLPEDMPVNNPDYWVGEISNGLEISLNSYSSLTEGVYTRDHLTPAEVLRQLDSVDNLRSHQKGVVVNYFDEPIPAVMETLGKQDLADQVFVMRTDQTSEPFIVKQMHPGIPDTFIITGKEKNHKVLDVSSLDNSSPESVWNGLVQASNTLTPVVRGTRVSETLRSLKYQYKALNPLSENLAEQRTQLKMAVHNAAKLVPPPGLGDLLDLQNRRDIATLGILLGSEELGLRFQTPSYINNKAPHYFPKYEMTSNEAGAWTHDIKLTPILFNGFEVAQSQDPIIELSKKEGTIELKNVPNENASFALSRLLKEHGITEVAKPFYDGYCMFKLDDTNQFRSTGYWCSPKAEKELTVFSVAELTGQTHRGERVFNHPRSNDQVESLGRDLVTKIYAQLGVSASEWQEGVDAITEGQFLSIPYTMTGVPISELAMKNLSREDFTTYVNQAIGLTTLDQEHKQLIIESGMKTNWKDVEYLVEGFEDQQVTMPGLH